jgi:hypothetical protein
VSALTLLLAELQEQATHLLEVPSTSYRHYTPGSGVGAGTETQPEADPAQMFQVIEVAHCPFTCGVAPCTDGLGFASHMLMWHLMEIQVGCTGACARVCKLCYVMLCYTGISHGGCYPHMSSIHAQTSSCAQCLAVASSPVSLWPAIQHNVAYCLRLPMTGGVLLANH